MTIEGISNRYAQVGELTSRSRQSDAHAGNVSDKVSIGSGEQPSVIVRRGHRHHSHDRSSESAPASSTTSENAANTQQTAATSSSSSSDLRTLAAKYVDQYAKEAGKNLTTEEKSALSDQVYNFYSDPARAGRLEKIVFAAN